LEINEAEYCSNILKPFRNHSECVWLRLVDGLMKGFCGFSNVLESPTLIYEVNAACIAQIKGDYIKGDQIKHILP
jgi:hypothetical protein